MKREVLLLALVSAADVYLFYYVLTSGGGNFAGLSAAIISVYLVNEWAQVFYRLGLKSRRPSSRTEGGG